MNCRENVDGCRGKARRDVDYAIVTPRNCTADLIRMLKRRTRRRKCKVTLAPPSTLSLTLSPVTGTLWGLSDEFHFTELASFLPFPTDDLRDIHRPPASSGDPEDVLRFSPCPLF